MKASEVDALRAALRPLNEWLASLPVSFGSPDGEVCEACGDRYDTVYRIPDDVWAKITPREGSAGTLCLPCADRRASCAGISLFFEASVGRWDGEA